MFRPAAVAVALLSASPALAQGSPIYIRCEVQYQQGRYQQERSSVEYFRLSQGRLWRWDDGDHFTDVCAIAGATCTIDPARIEFMFVASSRSIALGRIDRRSGDYNWSSSYGDGGSDSAQGRCDPSGPPPSPQPPRF